MSLKTLIVTIPPTVGGVPTKTAILARLLRDADQDVTVAHYATLSENPTENVSARRLLSGAKPSVTKTTCFDDFPCIRVGCYLPELEFQYYRTTPCWREVLSGYDRYIAVGGTVLVSNLLRAVGIKHITWCASTMIDDRIDRRNAMPPPRRLIDRSVIGPVQRVMERNILAEDTKFMAVSTYAMESLIAAGGKRESFSVVPVPVDADVFRPGEPIVGRIGMAGRHEDPRKNVALLLEAIRLLRQRSVNLELHLTGTPSPSTQDQIARLGLSDDVVFHGWMDEPLLPAFFASLDVFVFSSHKEGLGISGVQAIACGTPVVSTRCGGPEDYVKNGETGFLVSSDATEMADAIEKLVRNRSLRQSLGANARDLAVTKYSNPAFAAAIDHHLAETWP